MATRTMGPMTPAKIAGIYLLFGFGWILSTDYLLFWFVDSAALLTTIQTVKGVVFVALSGLLIYWLTSYYHREQEEAQETLEVATEQLQVLQRVLRHNLRNDLNVVLSRVEQVEHAVEDARLTDHLDAAKDQVAGVIDLSNKMRVTAEVDPQTDQDGTLELTGPLRSRLDELEASDRVGSVEADLPPVAHVRGDATIEHVIDELLDNAISHNPEPPEERSLTVTLEETDGDVRLEIRDNGTAIPPAELEALEAGSETELLHMSGIGLWVAKWLCEYNGGDIAFEDHAGGTSVRLTFEAVTPTPVVEKVTGTLVGLGTATIG